MPSLNIKDPRGYRLVKEISETTGETLTVAVIVSLEERLARLRRQLNVERPPHPLTTSAESVATSSSDINLLLEDESYGENDVPQ